MADAKISALTALTGALLDATADVVAIVDTSITTTKKMTADELNIGLHASTTVTRFKVGTFSRDMTAVSGNVAYTGVGFKPKAVIFLATVSNTSRMSIGVDDGTNRGDVLDQYPVLANSYASSTSHCIAMVEGNNVTFQTASINSMDADGFTLAWVKDGSPSAANANIIYLAFR